MKSLFSSILLLFAFNAVFAQGIDFKHIGYEEALELAKKEHKLVFIDFYTEWCGPCKKLAAGPFLDEKVGEVFNKKFISIKQDAEKEGREVAKKYKVFSYPTLMFLATDEEILLSSGGFKTNEKLIELANNAASSFGSTISMESLQKMYPEQKNDEDFLLMYIEKMLEYVGNPGDALEQWLKVQNSVEEDSRDMYEFFDRHNKFIYFGEKAGEIFTKNKKAYYAFFPNSQNKVDYLEQMLVRNTLKAANTKKSPELMRTYINKSRELESSVKHPFITDYNEAELQYLILAGNINAYKSGAKAYVDSIIGIMSYKEIKAEDKRLHDALVKMKANNNKDELSQTTAQKLNDGAKSNRVIKPIVDQGYTYLRYCESKSDYKELDRWINYCYKLSPGKYSVDLLKSDMLFKQGKKQEAIELKEAALEKTTTEKQRMRLQAQIDDMKK